jgi:hypothetical protein
MSTSHVTVRRDRRAHSNPRGGGWRPASKTRSTLNFALAAHTSRSNNVGSPSNAPTSCLTVAAQARARPRRHDPTRRPSTRRTRVGGAGLAPRRRWSCFGSRQVPRREHRPSRYPPPSPCPSPTTSSNCWKAPRDTSHLPLDSRTRGRGSVHRRLARSHPTNSRSTAWRDGKHVAPPHRSAQQSGRPRTLAATRRRRSILGLRKRHATTRRPIDAATEYRPDADQCRRAERRGPLANT